MVEEIQNLAYYAPRAIVLVVLIGTGSSLVFLMICLFCLNDLQSVLTL
jgi:choline transport protein